MTGIQPDKIVVRLQEVGDTAVPRLDEQGGHGMNPARNARDADIADLTAVEMWKSGAPAWQPKR